MLFTQNNLEEFLKEWGAKKRLAPPQNEILKAKVISELKPSGPAQFRRPIGFWRLALIGGAAFAAARRS